MDKNLGNQCTADDDSVFHESLEGENKSKEGDSQESCLDKFCNMARSPKSHGSSTLHSNNAPRNAQDKGNELEILNGCNFTPAGNLRGDISQPYLSIILDALQTKFKDVYRTIEAGFAKLAYSDSPPQWFLKYIETNKLYPAFENQIPHSCHCFSYDKAAESDKQQRFKSTPSEQQAIETLLRRALTELEVTKDELMKLESQSSRHTEEILMLKERYRDLQEVLDHKETTLMGSSPQSTLLKNEGASDQAVEVENSFREDFQKVQGQLSTMVKGKDSILSNNQKIKALTQSLESERYELGETIGESCQKISQLGESVPNQEEALDLFSNINSAAKSGTVATEPAFSECNTRASSFKQTNIKPTDKPTYPSDYAKVYKLMSEKELPVPIGLEKFRFCQPLLNKCQQDYEKQTNGEEETVSVQKALDELNILQEVLLPKALQEPDTEEKKGELLVDPDTRNVKEKCNLLGKVRDAKEIPKLGEIYQDLQQDLEKNETILTDSSLQSAFVTSEGALDQPVEVEHCLKEDLQKVQNQQYATVKDAVLSKTIVTDTASEGERDLQINLTENQIIQREEQEEGNNIDRVDLLSASVAASALGKWEKHTKGIGSKIMAKLGYVMGSGLGKHGEGRTEPVEAIVLPRGKSLDHCMEIKEKAKGKRLLRVKKGSKRKSLIGKEQEIKFIKEQTGEENHFLFSFDLLKTRTSSGITDNQKMKVPIRSLQSERNELGETVDESCQKVSQLGESVLNEEEALDLPSNMVGAAKSGIVATEHPLLECNTKASSFNQTNIKNLEIATEGQLNKLICDKLTKTTVSYFIQWLFLWNFKKIDAKNKLDVLFHVLYVKVVNEQISARKYTEVCKLMFEIEVPFVSGTGIVSFQRLLLDRCRQTFGNQKKYEEEIASKRKALREAGTEEKKTELQTELDERLEKLKLILLGNISFFGEFFKLKMVTIEHANFCISELLKSRTEEHLECLCKFISTIGKAYEKEYDAKFKRAAVEAKSSGKQMHIQLTKLDVYLDEMRKLSQSEDLSSAVRLMLMEVLDLKRNQWVPHREEDKPKTIEEIRGGVQKEKLEKKLSLQKSITKQPQMRYPSQRRDGGRSNESKKSNNHEINAPNRFLESERQCLGENIDESCHKIPHLKQSVLNEEEALNLPSTRSSAHKSGIVATKSALSKSDIKASSLYQTKVKNLEIAIAQKLKLETLMHDCPKKTVNDVMKTLIGFKMIDAEKKLDVLVHILYVKATGKPICALEYAKLCKLLSERGLPGGPRKVSFRQLLLNRCQQSFEKQMKDKEETVSILKALQDADTEEKKAKLLVKLNKRKEEEKRNLLGNVRFTGELFKLKIFKIEVMNFFLSELLRSRTEEHLECLCELVSTIGKTHEEESNGYHQFHLTNLDVYLDEMRKLSHSTNLSSTIRFMLIDVLELKERAWVPIRNEEYCRQSPSLSGNQEVKAPTQSLELERYELGGTIDESCHKVSQLGESVLNQEEALNLSRNKSIAAKSGIVATEPAVLDRYSRVSISNQTNVKNLKTNIVLLLNRLICDSPKKMDVSNFTGWLFHSNFIEIDAEKKIDVLVHVMYVKVTEKPEYAPKLAEVLKLLSEKEVPLVRGRGKVSLCQLIVNRCQQTFERQINSKEKIVSKQEALREAETEEKKAELLVKPDERIAKEKQVLLGFIRFAGELFNSKMLTIETMDFCISELLKLRTEGQLECLCELLSLIGKSYEQEYDAKYQRAVAESENKSQPLQFQLTKLDVYLNEMREICGGKSTDVSSCIRIMLTDVLDLKERAWVPHQNEENCQKEKRKRDRSSRKTGDS